MSFRDWLSEPLATATSATPATHDGAAAGTVATVATVAVAAAPELKQQPAVLSRVWTAKANSDIAAGWRQRQTTSQWGSEAEGCERQWRGYLERYPGSWLPPEPYETKCRINEQVAAWNRMSGQDIDPREVIAQLSQDDYRDPLKVNRGALMRLVSDACRMLAGAGMREAFEERAAILEYDAGYTRKEAERLSRLQFVVQRSTPSNP